MMNQNSEKEDVEDRQPDRCSSCGLPRLPDWIDSWQIQIGDLPATQEEFEAEREMWNRLLHRTGKEFLEERLSRPS